jgi:hypothetical protein
LRVVGREESLELSGFEMVARSALWGLMKRPERPVKCGQIRMSAPPEREKCGQRVNGQKPEARMTKEARMSK